MRSLWWCLEASAKPAVWPEGAPSERGVESWEASWLSSFTRGSCEWSLKLRRSHAIHSACPATCSFPSMEQTEDSQSIVQKVSFLKPFLFRRFLELLPGGGPKRGRVLWQMELMSWLVCPFPETGWKSDSPIFEHSTATWRWWKVDFNKGRPHLQCLLGRAFQHHLWWEGICYLQFLRCVCA